MVNLDQSVPTYLDSLSSGGAPVYSKEPVYATGLADLNHLKSIDFFIKISDLIQYFWSFENYGQIKAVLVK